MIKTQKVLGLLVAVGAILLASVQQSPAPPGPCYIPTLGWTVADVQTGNGRRFDVSAAGFDHMSVDYTSPTGTKWTVYSNVPSAYVGAVFGQFHVVVNSLTCPRQWDLNHPQTP